MINPRSYRQFPFVSLMRCTVCVLCASCFVGALRSAAQGQTIAKRAEPIENSIGMKLVFIPPGEFMMGTSDADIEKYMRADRGLRLGQFPSEQPQNRVRITKGFYMGVYEVTQAEYARVMGTNPSFFSKDGPGKELVAGRDTSRFPVEQVSWDDAQEFCRKLSTADAEKREGRRYRLPTEAQWEYACRAGTTTAFHFGDECTARQANVNSAAGAFDTTKKAMRSTKSVGSYKENALGLFDMHGNVFEWCEDFYHADFYQKRMADDPVNTTGKLRVLRGGCWMSVPRQCRAASRGYSTPKSRLPMIGFRVCCSIERDDLDDKGN